MWLPFLQVMQLAFGAQRYEVTAHLRAFVAGETSGCGVVCGTCALLLPVSWGAGDPEGLGSDVKLGWGDDDDDAGAWEKSAADDDEGVGASEAYDEDE